MDEPFSSAQLPPEKPTAPTYASRFAWVAVIVLTFAFLLLCAALILVAAWRGG